VGLYTHEDSYYFPPLSGGNDNDSATPLSENGYYFLSERESNQRDLRGTY